MVKNKLNNRNFFVVFISLISLALLVSAAAPLRTSFVIPPDINSYLTMRVAIRKNVDSAKLEFSAPFKALNPVTGDIIVQGLPQRDVQLNAAKDGIVLGSKLIRLSSFHLVTEDEMIQVEGRTYRNALRIYKDEKGKLILVNEIPLDEYVKGVLPKEIDPRWHMEAIKAQAIAARTFALFQALKDPNAKFYLTNDVYSQVYGGKTSEHSRTSQAVDETKGQVLTYRGMLFPTYFHSSCGGKTTQAQLVWNVMPISPLNGIQCEFCNIKENKYYNWHSTIPLEEIQKKFSDRGYSLTGIRNIEGVERDRSGRYKKVAIYHSKGVYTMRSGDFRLIAGAEKMRSTLVNIKVSGGQVEMTGNGWGHGVGLCQWGSKEMADRGFTHENILRFYYPGSQITQAYFGPAPSSEGNIFSRWWSKIIGMFN